MSWSTTYDQDYLDGLDASRRSAEAAGDTETVDQLNQQEQQARENYGQDIE